jgi:hypothetical protein
MHADMCDIPADIAAPELSRRILAFHDDFRGIPLTVGLHGVRFRLARRERVPPLREARVMRCDQRRQFSIHCTPKRSVSLP